MKIIAFSKDINHTDRYRNMLSSYTFRIVNEFDDLFLEARREQIIILMNIDDCEDELNSCLSPLIESNAYLIILDNTPEYEKGKKLISLGVRAYGNLMMDDSHLKDAINSVIDGNIWLYPEFINETVVRMRYETNPNTIDLKLDILTSREKEVAHLVIEKLSYLEISERLNITLRTVKAHTKSIYDKFNVLNRLSFLLLFK
jgi:DNA-binding NarL/FixJ family response regulator